MYHLYEKCCGRRNSSTYLTLIFSCSYANDMKNCLRDNHSRLNGVDYTKFEEVHPSRNNLSSIQGNRKLTFLHAQWKIYFWRIQGVALYYRLPSPAHQVIFFKCIGLISNIIDAEHEKNIGNNQEFFHL